MNSGYRPLWFKPLLCRLTDIENKIMATKVERGEQ